MSDAAEGRATVLLAGRITAAVFAGIGPSGFPSQLVVGRITTATSAGASPGTLRQFIAGTVTAKVTAGLAVLATGLPLSGQITTMVRAGAGVIQPLRGRIEARVTAHLAVGIAPLPITRISARISIALQASAVPQVIRPPGIVGGSILATVSAKLHHHNAQYVSPLAGRTSITVALRGVSQPWQPSLIGRITTAVRVLFGTAEVQTPPEPYPPPFLTYDVEHYLDYVTSEHNQRPRYMATVGMSVDPVVEDQWLVASILGKFDLDYCIGEQEDFTGQWIGKSRWIELPAVFFSWDEEGLGWNQANWRGPGDASTSLERLDDYHYRLLLYATVIANHWNGSIPAAYEAWDTLFQYTGLKVVIQDYGNMTMLYGLLSESAPDIVLLSLFTTGQMDLRPEGIALRAYALQPTPGEPFFAWDAASDSVHGWDTGYWALILEPGQSYIPGVGTLWDIPAPTQHPGERAATDAPQTHWDIDHEVTTIWDRRR